MGFQSKEVFLKQFKTFQTKYHSFFYFEIFIFFIVLLHLKFKEILQIASWCTHSLLNHSKQTYKEKKWGFKLERFEVVFQNISNKISQFQIFGLNYFSLLCCISGSKKYCGLLVGAPIAFQIIQNGPKMKKIWGFKLKRFKVSFSKHLKQNIIVPNFYIIFFSPCFVAFGV